MPRHPARYAEGGTILYRATPTDDIRPRFWAMAVLPVVWIVVLLLLANDWRSDHTFSLAAWCGLPIMLLTSVGIVVWSVQAQDDTLLRLDSSGLTYEGLDFSVTTSWDNIERVQDGPLPRLILHQRALTALGLHSFADAGWYVPLERFRYTRQSALAADLEHFAPRLYRS